MIPPSAKAYSFNFTAIPRTKSLGFLSVWPEGQPRPTVSTLNDPTGTIVANAAIVPAGTSGGITVYPTDDTDLAIDVNGYFAPAGTGGLSLYVLTPCRVLDTRKAGGAFSWQAGDRCVEQRVWATEFGAGLCVQCDGGAAGVVGLSGVVAGWATAAGGLHAERTGWRDHVEHGDCAGQHAGKIDAFAANGITNLLMDISSYFAP